MTIKEHDILVRQEAISGPLGEATYTNEGSKITAQSPQFLDSLGGVSHSNSQAVTKEMLQSFQLKDKKLTSLYQLSVKIG